MEINPETELPVDNTDEDTVVLKKTEHDAIVESLSKGEEDKKSLVAEIKDLREKKQATEAKADELKKKLEESKPQIVPGEESPVDIEATVNEILSQRDAADVDERKEQATRKFKETNKEFHVDNDEGGIKWSALERKLALFNLSGLKSEAQFLDALNDARSLLTGGESNDQEETPNPYPSTPSDAPAEPREADPNNLTSQELKIIQDSFGGDKERYLKIKTTRPDYVDKLLQFAK